MLLQASIHSIKSRFPDITSLRDYYVAKYEENSPNFKLAQVEFDCSVAQRYGSEQLIGWF